MDSEQYEELCRRFIAKMEGLRLEDVRSERVPSPTGSGVPEYEHQLDLRWETGGAVARYINIANAKWRSRGKVDQPDVMLLHQVRQDVRAHKAVMITNVGFTQGAIAAAQDKGIALHILKPEFDPSALPKGSRAAIQVALDRIASDTSASLWSDTAVHRGLGFANDSGTADAGQSHRAVVPQTRIAQPGSGRAQGIQPGRGPSSGPSTATRGGGQSSGGTTRR